MSNHSHGEGQDHVRDIVRQAEDALRTKFCIEHLMTGTDWDGNSTCSLQQPGRAAASHSGHAH